MAINLTTKKVEQLRKTPGRYRDKLVKNLLLVVTGPNSASWQLRYEHGKERWMGLGSVRDLPLAAARERARAARLQLLDGIDPLDQRRAEKAQRKAAALKAMTFKQCAESYLAAHSGKWRNVREAPQWTNSLAQYVHPILGNLSVSDIDTPLILKVLEQPVEADGRYPAGPLWLARHETASRLRGRIEAVLGWATVRQYRTGDNPARWSGHLATVLPGSNGVAQEHFSALPFAEMPAFVAALRETTAAAARALEFLILTAARSGEVLGAKWSEIHMDEAVWTVSAERMKAQREHRVPLSGPAVDLLKGLYTQEGNPYVFIGDSGGALGPMAMRRVLRQLGKDGITVHGFRSAFRDWAGEQTAFPHDVCEAALAHSRGDQTVKAYARGDLFDKRRRLMEAWASYLASPAKATGEVVPLKRAN
jgi:integrase